MANIKRLNISIPITLWREIKLIQKQIPFNISKVCQYALKSHLIDIQETIKRNKQIEKQVKELNLNKYQIEYIKVNL